MKPLRNALLLLVIFASASAMQAADFGVRAGRMNDSDEDFVGVEMAIGAGPITFNPNIEYWLIDDITAGSANLDMTYDIVQIGTITPYAGAGLGIFYVDDDFGSETDVLGNLIGGIAFDLDFLRPYAQVKYMRVLDSENGGDDDDLALTIGLRF
jgi:hypothetical protein